ncbi:MAG: hypothetical protein CVU88_01260 [Firmicutes bacterium HGW-Firmicutes-13]|nr:MAG: hypothetical protein CVU88_01260 [Firmicutes bacterium HGW-Firmicutes-13]
MRDTNYGLKIGKAFKAIITMHQDVRKLLLDCDSLFSHGESIFDNTVTSDLSYSINASWWLAEGVFRYWNIQENYIVGTAVLFFSEDDSFEQPLFIAGRLKYSTSDSGEPLKNICDRWDLWYAVEANEIKFNIQTHLDYPDEEGRIEWLDYIIIPLFNIESFEDVREQFKELGIQV